MRFRRNMPLAQALNLTNYSCHYLIQRRGRNVRNASRNCGRRNNKHEKCHGAWPKPSWWSCTASRHDCPHTQSCHEILHHRLQLSKWHMAVPD